MADSLYDQFQVSISNYVDLTQKNSSETQKVISQQGAAAQDIANLLKEIGTTQVIQKQSEVAATLTAQERNLATARSAGVDPEKGVNKINDAIALQAAEQEKLVTSLQELNRIDNLGISDLLADPLGTLKAKVFDRSGVESKVAQSAALTKVLHSNVQEIAQTMNSSFQVNAAIKQTMTAASADAAVRAVNLASQIQVRDAEIKAWNYNLLGIENAQKGSKDLVEAQLQRLQANNAQTNLGLAIASARREEARFDIQQQLANDALLDAQENRQGLQSTLDKYNLGAALIGRPKVSMGEFKAIKDQWGKGGMADDSYIYRIGAKQAEAMAGGSAEGMFGSNAAEALQTIDTLKLKLGPEAKVTEAVLRAANEKLNAEAAKMDKVPTLGPKPENAAARAEFLNAEVRKMLNGYSSRTMLPGDKSNPLNFGSIATRFDLPEFASIPLVKEVLSPMNAAGVPMEDNTTVFNMVVDAVSNKKISGAEAVKQYVQMNKKAYVMNVQAKQLDRLGGLKVDKPQYKINVDIGDYNMEVNALDETEVTHALSRKLASQWRK